MNDDEAALVERAKAGDLLSFACLFEDSEPAVLALCLRLLRYEGEARLIVEDVFLTAFRHLGSLPAEVRFQHWVLRLAAHRCLFVIRARTDRPEPTTEYSSQLDAALTTLSVDEHLAWVLHEVDGQPLAAIAEILQVSPEKVQQRFHRARSALGRLADEGADAGTDQRADQRTRRAADDSAGLSD
ncbi:RNA polymerase sigma factor [Nesterenkonia halotolerans]|uniref:RNA polymerase sigma-70 factor (ECF subfamily) n=1 Tax=Nesterenkonia halotolerans TaxID=225325 RepID=A0ABR9J9R5_9MICC|nr:RNA polymerase sigma factor [Nesterenkonia halotolerans]MBE1515728.1 RNA polymerase sigma-70 factor (ECF subfamily) [Nesterenkonia halotolerans]